MDQSKKKCELFYFTKSSKKFPSSIKSPKTRKILTTEIDFIPTPKMLDADLN